MSAIRRIAERYRSDYEAARARGDTKRQREINAEWEAELEADESAQDELDRGGVQELPPSDFETGPCRRCGVGTYRVLRLLADIVSGARTIAIRPKEPPRLYWCDGCLRR